MDSVFIEGILPLAVAAVILIVVLIVAWGVRLLRVREDQSGPEKDEVGFGVLSANLTHPVDTTDLMILTNIGGSSYKRSSVALRWDMASLDHLSEQEFNLRLSRLVTRGLVSRDLIPVDIGDETYFDAEYSLTPFGVRLVARVNPPQKGEPK